MAGKNSVSKKVVGRARGGVAAAAKLTKEERSARARAGAKARWATREKPQPAEDAEEKNRRIGRKMLRAVEQTTPEPTPVRKFSPPALMPGVVPEGKSSAIAMDYAPGCYDFANSMFGMGGANFDPFPGYPYLAGLATRAEYRNFADTISSELTREWIKFRSTATIDGADGTGQDKTRITELEKACKTFNLQDIFKLAAAQDSFFGRAQISINIKGADNRLPLVLAPQTIKKGSLESFTCIEAMWTTPSAYNSYDPTAPDFYKPREWFVLGKQMHASRLLTIITRPVPDMLKPAYNFSGMSLSQLAEPYVNNWLRTRQSVSDLINNFSITALKTDMAQMLQGECDATNILLRAKVMTQMRSNQGVLLLDKDKEDLAQVNTPLSGLHELQAQSQEHMCSVSRTPAIILTGISPSGLNASSDGEIRVWYDWIAALQNAFYRHPLEICIKVLMLHLWGEIDETIVFDYVPLWQPSLKEEAEIRTADANATVQLIDRGVLSPEEARRKLASDPNSGYAGIDVEDLPPNPEDVGATEFAPGQEPLPSEIQGDKSVNEAQHKAMAAAAGGNSTLGIPKNVGEEFMRADKK